MKRSDDPPGSVDGSTVGMIQPQIKNDRNGDDGYPPFMINIMDGYIYISTYIYTYIQICICICIYIYRYVYYLINKDTQFVNHLFLSG